MIISLKWLKEYVDLDSVQPEDIVEKLTSSGAEVEEVIDKASDLKNIVVAEVKNVKKHPNADRLSVCEVFDGIEKHSVVCGAPNVKEGQRVPFAKVGAVIPNGKFKIKSTKIRGEKSSGMICAEDELGLSDNHSGIMVLNEKMEIGKPLAEALNLEDIILDIAITPNRADALSHLGIARDLGAIYGKTVNYPKIPSFKSSSNKNEFAEVIIENAEDCPRYSAVVVKNVKVKESPDWLKEKLLSLGLRPINNIVDVTNFMLHELGQPLHAFDLEQLSEHKIAVRNINHEFTFSTLDSKERSMLPTDLMICDGEKPVAIAGVMGGENSEVTDTTKNILIESAYFKPASVRKTAKHLSLSTDSSYRFERGTDPNGTLNAAVRAASLIQGVAGGEIIENVIDVYPKEIKPNTVTLRYDRINKILGFHIDSQNVNDILTRLEFEIIESDQKSLLLKIPTFRHDIEREIDLIEEVVRIYGFEKIPPINKIGVGLSKKIDETEFTDLVRDKLVSLGLNEVISNSLLNELKTISSKRSLKVINPQSSEMSMLRTSLIPGMLQNISRNLKVKETKIRLYEIGQVFNAKSHEINSFNDFSEHESLLLAYCGFKNKDEWYRKENKFDFFDLIGALDSFLKDLKLNDLFENKYLSEGNEVYEYFIEKSVSGKIVGFAGKINQKLLDTFEINNDVFLCEINLDLLRGYYKNEIKFNPLLKFPKIYRDFGFILDRKTTYKEVMDVILGSGSNLLKNVNLFDIFESEILGSDKKSLAFQLEYYDESRTLREDEIDKEFWKTIETVKTKLKGELRGLQ